MTTLHVQTDRLQSAVREFPTVASVSADPSFPHGVTIHVNERRPALVVHAGDRQVAVAANGSLLPGLHVKGQLPELKVDRLPDSGRLSGDPLSRSAGDRRRSGAAASADRRCLGLQRLRHRA